jgi:hypothetical protein
MRVIAFDAKNAGNLKTVNIVTSLPAGGQIKTGTQNTSAFAAANPNAQPTYMASASPVAGLTTVFISGYSAPN